MLTTQRHQSSSLPLERKSPLLRFGFPLYEIEWPFIGLLLEMTSLKDVSDIFKNASTIIAMWASQNSVIRCLTYKYCMHVAQLWLCYFKFKKKNHTHIHTHLKRPPLTKLNRDISFWCHHRIQGRSWATLLLYTRSHSQAPKQWHPSRWRYAFLTPGIAACPL